MTQHPEQTSPRPSPLGEHPSVARLLDVCRAQAEGSTDGAEREAATHVEQCRDCADALNSALLHDDEFIAGLRGANPLDDYAVEPELRRLVARADAAVGSGITASVRVDSDTRVDIADEGEPGTTAGIRVG